MVVSTIELPSITRENQVIDRGGNISASWLRGGLSHRGTVDAGSSPMAIASGRAVALPDSLHFDIAIDVCGPKMSRCSVLYLIRIGCVRQPTRHLLC